MLLTQTILNVINRAGSKGSGRNRTCLAILPDLSHAAVMGAMLIGFVFARHQSPIQKLPALNASGLKCSDESGTRDLPQLSQRAGVLFAAYSSPVTTRPISPGCGGANVSTNTNE